VDEVQCEKRGKLLLEKLQETTSSERKGRMNRREVEANQGLLLATLGSARIAIGFVSFTNFLLGDTPLM